MNSIILKSLRIYCKNQSDWSEILPAILMFYRASTTTSLGFSPFEVLFGRKMRTPIDTSLINDLRTAPNIDAYVQQMLPKIELTRQIARENTDTCKNRTRFYYNRDSAYPTYAVGQKVLMHDPVTKKGVSKKLKKRWIRPYLVTEVGDGHVYKLCHCESGQMLPAFVHSNRLRPFYEPRETAKMRSSSRTTNNQRLDDNSQDRNATNATLPDGWFEVTKINNHKTINGKIHFLVHWSDGSKSYEPEDNITDAAKAAYYASCRTKRKPRDRQ